MINLICLIVLEGGVPLHNEYKQNIIVILFFIGFSVVFLLNIFFMYFPNIADYLDYYYLIPSIIFFICLFQGYFGLLYKNIFKILILHPWIVTSLKYLLLVLFICIFMYILSDTVYAMPSESSDLSKAEVNVKDNHNTLSINNSTFNIPDSVAKGLTHLGTGAAVAAGVKAGASITKSTGFSPAGKLGAIAFGGFAAGFFAVGANAGNSIIQKKVDYSTTTSTSNTSSGSNSTSFSIEPGADMDTVMTLLNSLFMLHICILYFLWALLIIYISNKVVEKKWNLTFIENIFGKKVHSFVIKSLSYTSKSNNIWLIIIFFLLVFTVLGSLYFSHFILHNIDIISEIVQQYKSK